MTASIEAAARVARGPRADGGRFGREAIVLLPALSSIASRDEMRPLADALQERFSCILADWPGFGAAMPDGRSLAPEILDDFLHRDLPGLVSEPCIGLAAGHGAPYLVRAARRDPARFRALVLVAPTWRGPLPTMTRGRKPDFCRRVRRVLEAPVIGSALFRLNLSRPVIGWMMREHVYGDAAGVTAALVAAKHSIARRPGARQATAAFVSGALDPVASRAAFLALFADPGLPPMLMVRPRHAPRHSAAEMEALAASGHVEVAEVDGALAPHEEHPTAVAAAVATFVTALR